MINFNSISKNFGEFLALDDLSFRVNKGEFYCLLGPNGAGKTTSLKIISGLMKPTKGQVSVSGFDHEKNKQKIKKILGFIPDTPFLYDNLTSIEFIEFVSSIFSIGQKEVREKVEYFFQMFELDQYRNSLIRELSHGTKQKIVYVSTFIHSPLLYLIDEPLVGLDPHSIHQLKKFLKQEVSKGKTVLMCTHILSIAEELADRLGIIHKGKLITEGSPESIKKEYSAHTLEDAFLKIISDLKTSK